MSVIGEPIVAGVVPSDDRKEVARALLASGIDAVDLELEPALEGLPPTATLTADLGIDFPDGLAPLPQPPAKVPTPGQALPPADVLVVTWTVDEQDALADVFTPGHGRKTWYRYDRNFSERYASKIRPHAPAQMAKRLGSWLPTKIGAQNVLCFKSELHLNQDGIRTGDGTATLPVADLFRQLIAEVKPKVLLTIGTSGGVFPEHNLGDVVVTRAARFRLNDEFKKEPFAGQTFISSWTIPTSRFDDAQTLMARYAARLAEPAFAPPTKQFPFATPPIKRQASQGPRIWLEGRDLPKDHPILTTDYFEFGTSANHLQQHGCAVEMGDAVLGMVVAQMPQPPDWAVVRNLSDPVINGDLPTGPGPRNMQTHWAVWYYETYGYWTSVTGALAAWAIIAGLGG